jgi:hypothetical protein
MPRKESRPPKSRGSEQHDEADGPIRNLKKWKDLRRDLEQQPADDRISGRDFVNVAPPRFEEEVVGNLFFRLRRKDALDQSLEPRITSILINKRFFGGRREDLLSGRGSPTPFSWRAFDPIEGEFTNLSVCESFSSTSKQAENRRRERA